MLRLTCALKSAKRPLLSKLSPLWVAAALCAGLIGCGNSPDHAAGIDPGDAGTVKPIPTGNACDTPNDGCACATPGETVDCGRVERTSGSYVSCSMGQRTCTDDKWGACIGDDSARGFGGEGLGLVDLAGVLFVAMLFLSFPVGTNACLYQ